MKFVKMKCPQCGADLELNEDRITAFCSYCGCKLYVDDENAQDEVYEAHQRNKAKRLAKELDILADYITEKMNISGELQEAKAKYRSSLNDLKEIKNRRTWLIASIVGATVLFILGIIGSDSGILMKILLFVLACAVGSGTCYLGLIFSKNKENRNTREISSRKEDVEYLEDDLAYLEDQFDCSISLPEEYQEDLEAIAFFKKVLLAGRAHNLHDAILLYEDECHRKHLEEQLELQRKKMDELQKSIDDKKKEKQRKSQNDSSDDGDAGSLLGTAAAVGGAFIVGAKVLKEIDKHL